MGASSDSSSRIVRSTYLEHRAYVGRVLRRCGVAAAEVDDLTHEVFLILLRRIDEQRDLGSLRSWLFQAARRVASNHRRGSARARDRVERAARVPDGLAQPSSLEPDDAIARAQAAAFIGRFLAELDESSQRLFLLSEVEGLRGREVAADLGLNTQTAYSRIHALRRRFDRAAAREFGRPQSMRAWLAVGLFGQLARQGLRTKLGLGLATIALIVGSWWLLRPAPPTPPTPPIAGPVAPRWNPADEAELRSELVAKQRALESASAVLSGRVLDPEGRGIEDAWVCAWRHAVDFSTAIGEPDCVRSRADGEYRLTNITPGLIRLSAGAVDHLPGEVRYSPTGALQIEAGERSGLDIVLARGGATLTGVVEDLTGGPIEGARIVLRAGPSSFGGDPLTFGAWGDRAPTIVESGPDGRFVASTHPGLTTWQASAPGYARSRGDLTTPKPELVIRLAPGGALGGTVVDAHTREPLVGLRVIAWADARSLSEAAGVVLSDERGRFRIEGLPPGRYKPMATGPGALGLAETSVVLGLAETIDDLIIPVAAAPIVAGTVEIAGSDQPCPGALVGLMEGSLGRVEWQWAGPDGRVVFPAVVPGRYRPIVHCEGYRSASDYPLIEAGTQPNTDLLWTVEPGALLVGTVSLAGQPSANATVLIERNDSLPPLHRSLVTDGEGRFSLGGLEPGTYELSASTDQASTGAPVRALVDDDGAQVELVLGTGGSIRGVVTDEHDEPIAGAVVRLDPWATGETLRTNGEGRFAFEALPWRRYRISAALDDVARTATRHEVELSAASPELELALTVVAARGSIVGRVVDHDGAPLPDVLVGLGQSPAGAHALTTADVGTLSDAQGRFELGELPCGEYRVTALGPDGSTGSEQTQVTADTPAKIELVLPATASISGRLIAEGIELPSIFEVSATAPSGPAVVEIFSNTDGTWSLDGLTPGPTRIAAVTPAGRASASLLLEPGERRTDVELDLGQRVDLNGQLVDLDSGDPLSGFTVVAVSFDDGAPELARQADLAFTFKPGDPRQISDATGRFVVPSLGLGPVRLAAIPKGFPESPYPMLITVVELPLADNLRLPAPKHRLTDPAHAGQTGFELEEGEYDQPWTIAAIDAKGPAARLDLRPGDAIVAIDGHDVTGAYKYLAPLLLAAAPGTTVSLTLDRDATLELALAGP